ncbi:hypothetical protein [Herbaspirillum sp. YR522]|uniref:hypothetical protein n=1 Tax=Herbaspirillum sp. YR522 TaxID=1144342 RepID=UPI00026FC4FD|nr:hypothetical protein [Herbaspirillum sp. YR522]EJN02568.1 hypothetical protein PMI40_03106 [Herbaspirillum sp. YR522]
MSATDLQAGPPPADQLMGPPAPEPLPSSSLYLYIDNGKHQGARVELEPGQVLSIGSVLEADIYLTDAGVAPLHASIERIGQSTRWQAGQAPISLFGLTLPAGKSQLLGCDGEVGIGPVKMVVAGAERDPQQARRAHGALLRQRAPLRYVLFEWRRLSAGVRLGLGCATLAMALLGVALTRDHPGPTVESVQELATHMRRVFPHVKVGLDEQQAAVVYTGYVDQHQDLERLRLQAWNISTDIPLIRVFAMSEIAAAARTHLDRIYRSAHVRVTGPGTLLAEVPADEPAKSLDAWDFEAVAAAARRNIPGLLKLEVVAVRTELKQAQSVPLAQLGLNLVTGPSGTYLRGKNGEQLFAGAVIKEGTLLKIDPCKVLLHPAGTEVIYRFVNMEINNAYCR